MHLFYRNVNQAFRGIVSGIQTHRIPTATSSSRNGDVIKVVEPVIVTYTHPRERVLFNQARDCNPFFHLFESLWMLAGRNDVAPLAYYNSQIKDYSDDGKTLNGAYGYRWRQFFAHGSSPTSFDQLQEITDELRKDPDSRRCVLQMWSSLADLGAGALTKDKPCNTHAYFSVQNKRLDMTVCNRSNDLIWGMLGANVVHFSFLQEYLAACIGVDVGVYHQLTNNLHAYMSRWHPSEWIDDYTRASTDEPTMSYDQSQRVNLGPQLVAHPKRFDAECKAFIDSIDRSFEEPFLKSVAQPMMMAFRAHKERRYIGSSASAFNHIDRVWADDWRIAGTLWLRKRQQNWEKKKNDSNPYTACEKHRQSKTGANEA